MRAVLFSFVVVLGALGPGFAADGARLAYIINIYQYDSPAGPIKRSSGADTVADALAGFGYTVQRYNNVKKSDFEAALKEVYADSKGAEAAIVYVSGFAVGTAERNVVFASDALSGGNTQVLARAVEAKDIINAPRARLLNMIILDAPENGPMLLGLDSASGYSPFLNPHVPTVPNRLAVYTSSAPTETYGRLAPRTNPLTFARNFKLFLGRRERTAAEALKRISISVFYDSAYQQYPQVTGSLAKPYMLVHKNEASDITDWLAIQAKPDIKSFERFIRQYPGSVYVPFARQRLQELTDQ